MYTHPGSPLTMQGQTRFGNGHGLFGVFIFLNFPKNYDSPRPSFFSVNTLKITENI